MFCLSRDIKDTDFSYLTVEIIQMCCGKAETLLKLLKSEGIAVCLRSLLCHYVVLGSVPWAGSFYHNLRLTDVLSVNFVDVEAYYLHYVWVCSSITTSQLELICSIKFFRVELQHDRSPMFRASKRCEVALCTCVVTVVSQYCISVES